MLEINLDTAWKKHVWKVAAQAPSPQDIGLSEDEIFTAVLGDNWMEWRDRGLRADLVSKYFGAGRMLQRQYHPRTFLWLRVHGLDHMGGFPLGWLDVELGNAWNGATPELQLAHWRDSMYYGNFYFKLLDKTCEWALANELTKQATTC